VSFLDLSPASWRNLAVPGSLALALTLAIGCQKKDDHPPYLADCETNCSPLPGISIGTGSPAGGASSNPTSDAGPGTLTGQVLLLSDQTFAQGNLFSGGAVVSADGASGTPVTADWNGADNYVLDGVAREATNWVSVKPNLVGGDALLTYQAVRTSTVETVNLAVVSATTLDTIFNSLSAPAPSPNFGQVVLFFRSSGTGTPLAGLHVAMNAAALAAYRSGSTWVQDDGTAVTDTSGLVLFGNVELANSTGTQPVTVTKVASGSTPAVNAGTFAARVVEGAVSIATVDVAL
jgi:hypothetical protein